MATDAEIIRKAYDRETNPKAIERYRPWAWEASAVGANRDDLKRLIEAGYIIFYKQLNKIVLYLLTDKGTEKGKALSEERKRAAPSLPHRA